MSIVDYLILVQNFLLIVLVSCPAWILCKGKKKNGAGGAGGGATPSKNGGSNEPPPKSEIKPPTTDPNPSMAAKVNEEPKKDGSKDGEKKASGETKGDGAPDAAKTGDATKEKSPADPKSKEPSLKPFPKFEMPTESKKKKKLAENEVDKKAKMSSGFYQEKSDEDDTLEKVDSLRVEQSDKTKRSQKKKK
ncbi:hypothetical protein CAEBREN_24159 [Caenorhabditis brenneri]|uniref:Uncharacterized protein n=1 Tax=Caenorhabditis brenneri TaxID=135651 RepID=G0MTJ4_CAEBE|nr:hypothetical protein CAEBREN_24159 [Caenorhabditis brenneri]